MPNGTDFADLIDSFLNKKDDGDQIVKKTDLTLATTQKNGLMAASDKQWIETTMTTVGGHRVVGGVMNLGHFSNLNAALAEAARSEVSGARGVAVMRFTYTGAAGTVASFIFQTIKGDNISIQYIFDRGGVTVRSVTGATGGNNGVNPVRVENTWVHRLRWNGDSIEAVGYEPHDGTAPVLATVGGVAKTSQLPTAATASKSGLMSAAHYSKLSALPTNAALEQKFVALESRIAHLEERLAAGAILLEGQASVQSASEGTEE